MLKPEAQFSDIATAVSPGISWTAPLKGRPWMNPPKSVSVTDIAQQYIAAIGDAASANSVLEALETKMPLSIIAETFMMGGVSKGMHTLDAGVLVMPVIIEILKTVAELNDIEYVVFPEDVEAPVVPTRLLNKVISATTKTIAEQAQTPEMPEEEQTGLMARKMKVSE